MVSWENSSTPKYKTQHAQKDLLKPGRFHRLSYYQRHSTKRGEKYAQIFQGGKKKNTTKPKTTMCWAWASFQGELKVVGTASGRKQVYFWAKSFGKRGDHSSFLLGPLVYALIFVMPHVHQNAFCLLHEKQKGFQMQISTSKKRISFLLVV